MNEARQHLDIGGGKLLPLPLSFCSLEFKLPGNSVTLVAEKMYACFDETTRTGAIWRSEPDPHWVLFQPCLRTDFFERICRECKDYSFPGG